MVVTAYHTLEDRDNVESIESTGPIKCQHKRAWLGTGYYFWDTDDYWAHDWGKKTYANSYMIFECQIVIDEKTYDLYGNVAHKKEFREIYETLKETGYFTDKTPTVPKIIEYLKRELDFDYNSIRAVDYPVKMRDKLSYGGKWHEFIYIYDERVQICLIDKINLISQTFRAVFPENYVI